MKVSVDLSPEDIAYHFAELNSSEQARFFNHLARIASAWRSTFSFQLQYITEEDGLNLSGRRVMQEIGEYSHWGLACKLGRKNER